MQYDALYIYIYIYILHCITLHYHDKLQLALYAPPVQVAAGDDDHDCKWSIFASWYMLI